jgi:hypothetical protein
MTAPATIIPKSAREIIEVAFESGVKCSAFYELDGGRVGFRCWDEDGTLTMEYQMRRWSDSGVERVIVDPPRHLTALDAVGLAVAYRRSLLVQWYPTGCPSIIGRHVLSASRFVLAPPGLAVGDVGASRR